MKDGVVFFLPLDSERMKQAFDIRRKVFVIEQDVPEDLEIDGIDCEASHFLLYADGISIGTCRVREVSSGCWKLERFAVLADYRGLGYGKKLLTFVEELAEVSGITVIKFNAQLSAKGFYEALGYGVTDDCVFDEAGISHIKMAKEL